MTFFESRRRSGIVAVDAGTGAVIRVGETWAAVKDVAWMPDGRSFITDGADSEDTPRSQLWQVIYPSGERRRVTNDLDGYSGVSLSEDATTLATVQTTRQSGVWVLAPGAAEGKEIDLRAGRGPGLGGLDWTLDGRLVFGAGTGGTRHIWVAAADGSGARQVTSGEHGEAFPRMSPDGRSIYYARLSVPIRIARIGIDGSDQRTLVGTFRTPALALSPDGGMYFNDERNRVMRMPTDGGDAAPVGDLPFVPLDVSPDGKTLLGVMFNREKLRSECATMPAGGGAPRLLGELGPTGADILPSCRWDPSGTAITYVAFRYGQFNMFMRSLAGGEERQLTHFRDGLQIFSAARAPDGRIALSRGRRMSDVVLISSAR
jgi:Tol biopolymer transport system component